MPLQVTLVLPIALHCVRVGGAGDSSLSTSHGVDAFSIRRAFLIWSLLLSHFWPTHFSF